jgi:Lrp/AsnC family leucine-responsive transcriptional regulator
MVRYSLEDKLDELDLAILRELQRDGRISNVELARRINLSPPATHARVRRLEEEGFIRKYVSLLDQEMVGYEMTCFISVSLQLHQHEELEEFHATIKQIPEVLECYHVTGEFDYLLKVVVRSRQDLQRLIVNRLTPLPGVARIYTSLVLSAIKATTELALPG